MRMRALVPWYNSDHEGRVEVGDQFEASPHRARDLERLGLALPTLSETTKIVVMADPPATAKSRRQSNRS